MPTIHCHLCGGFIGNPLGTRYRAPNAATQPVVPHSALCVCDHPVIYGMPEPAPAEMYRIRSASRN